MSEKFKIIPTETSLSEQAGLFDALRETGFGVLKNGIVVSGNAILVSLLNCETLPFDLRGILDREGRKDLPGDCREVKQVRFFDLEREQEKYSLAIFPIPGENACFFLMRGREEFSGVTYNFAGFEQKYQRLFDNVKDTVFASTVEGRFLDINPAGVEMLGYATKEEILGMNILSDLYYYPEDRVTYQKIIAEKGYVKDYEVIFKKKDGSPLFVSMSSVAVYDEERKVLGYEGIFRDLTERKKVEEALRQKNAQLESFVATVSHDLKTPVISIQGFAGLLLKHYSGTLDEKGTKMLQRIRDIARRAERMIQDLLAFSRAEKSAMGDFEFINTYQVISSIIEETKMKWRGRSARFIVEHDLPEILFHPGSFRHIMSNLIDNAVKYSEGQTDSLIKIGCQLQGEAVVFHVRDNGVGIDPSLHRKIFDVFERGDASEETEGTGIGLSFIKRIIDVHHGKIWLESEKGQGATFFVELPVKKLRRPDETSPGT
jgi:PAS domain S-box-containing protein